MALLGTAWIQLGTTTSTITSTTPSLTTIKYLLYASLIQFLIGRFPIIMIGVTRSATVCEGEQQNLATAFLDGSQIYGGVEYIKYIAGWQLIFIFVTIILINIFVP